MPLVRMMLSAANPGYQDPLANPMDIFVPSPQTTCLFRGGNDGVPEKRSRNLLVVDRSYPVTLGADRTFTISPDAGYDILEVVVGIPFFGDASTYTFHDVSVDRTITVSFDLAPTLTPVPSPTAAPTM